jgi:hypothetical protein
MSFMDQALGGFKPLSPDDIGIELPTRREPKKEPEAEVAPTAQPDAGEHGGAASSDAGAAGNDSPGEAAASSASEPVPQRDDPDEGEHTDSTEEQVATRARQAAAARVEETKPEPEVADNVVEPAETDEPPAPEPRPERPSLQQVLATTEGTAPRAFKRIAFSSGEDTPETNVARVPQPLIDHLRRMLAPSLGGTFAESISAPALLTAFLTVKAGITLELDDNTAAAADAFRQFEPRLAAVEDRVEEVSAGLQQLADAIRLGLKRTAESGDVLDVLEYGLAYLITDRVAGVSTVDVDETTVDVTQKKVLRARETIRSRSRAHRTIERQKAGRSTA